MLEPGALLDKEEAIKRGEDIIKGKLPIATFIDKPENRRNMADVKTIASRAKDVTLKYAPSVLNSVNEYLNKATGGKVTNVTDVTSYVGNDAARLRVTTEAMLRGGVAIDDILPKDLTGSNQQLTKLREVGLALVATLGSQYDRGSDKSLAQGPANIAADVLRKKRVRAVIDVYGTKENYFLCHPNGGVPVEDFVWYDQVIRKA